LDENPHNTVFPAGDNNPDDMSTGQPQGVYEGIPIGISTFKCLPPNSIVRDMVRKAGLSKLATSTLPVLPDAATLLPTVTQANVESVFNY